MINYTSITPMQMSFYLSANNWKFKTEDNLFQVWRSVHKGNELEVHVPLHPDWADYSRRLKETISLLAQIEARDAFEVVEEIKEF